ncbi:DUF4184 family protein [Acinetobacter shaoyimingii]|uniref:DUF4184 family protein n=1 Tax=Acinetobacter shaoyimingii TaxID=2715164 RepID=A0A6G8RY15_9GAMM|nr:DUF4184 family protein [Acinetobacter shaoyimingii]QIO06842.1 DUF4184 family protein [Acinetobacter shaoyimingii]
MPFTISHAVLAPPLAKLSKHFLPLSALAIGTMTPDLFRLFVSSDYGLTHEWKGIIVPDLLIGLFFCLLWYALFRPVVFRTIGIKKPLNINSFDQFCGFVLRICAALIVGIATHLIWDGLTHSDFRTFAFNDFLNQKIVLFGHEYVMHRILQISTSIIALPILFWMIIQHIRLYRVDTAISAKMKRFAFGLIGLATICGLINYAQFALTDGLAFWSKDLYLYIGRSINQFSRAWLLIFSLGCAVFLFLDYRKYFDR